MTSSDSSLLGFAKQTALGTPNVTDASFKYLLFNEGGMGPENRTLPLDPEVGGGAMLRDVVKVGVLSRGQIAFIPRPDTIGNMLLGALGTVRSDTLLYQQPLTITPITTGIGTLAQAATLSVVASGSATGDIIIVGTKVGGGAETETLSLNGTTLVTGVKSFLTVTSVTPPAVSSRTFTLTANPAAAHTHSFFLGADQFAAPYYTFRTSPGALWGEQFQDCRFSALNLGWRGANFVRGEAAMMGGLPAKLSPATWAAPTKTDGGPQFLAPVSNISVPTGSLLKVISGSLSFGMNVPMDEQWITGSYSPDAFDITQRAFQLSLVVKLTDAVLYDKAMYSAAGGSAWAVDMLREADIDINLKSAVEIATGIPYSIKVAANGASGSGANVVWSAQAIALRPGKQITMALSGTFLADPAGGEPVTVTLVNGTASY